MKILSISIIAVAIIWSIICFITIFNIITYKESILAMVGTLGIILIPVLNYLVFMKNKSKRIF